MCKIISKKIINGKLEPNYGTGFFLEIDIKEIPSKRCLITNNHILNEDDIKINKYITIEKKKKKKEIKITEKRKVYTNKELDYTCIEILKNDKIEDYFKIDNNLMDNSIKIYKDYEIFILQYPKGNELSFSDGIILGIQDSKLIHNCSTCEGSSGSPIILRSNNSIIGLHYGSDEKINLANNFISIFNDIKMMKMMKIFIINTIGSAKLTFDFESTDYIKDIKDKIQDKVCICHYEPALIFEGKQLEDNRTLAYYNIQRESTIYLVVKPRHSGTRKDIYIKTLGGKTVTIDFDPGLYIRDIKAKIKDKENIPSEKQRLIFAGKELEDNKRVTEYDIRRETTIHLAIRDSKGNIKLK